MANDNQTDQNNETQGSQESQESQSGASAESSGFSDSQDHELGEPTLESQLAAALEEINELKDQMIREKAETQNIRKRLQRDVENAHKFALEKFVNELLPVADNLERALAAATDDEVSRPLLEGVELTQKSFLDTLKKFNVEQLNPLGEPFDPQIHEAMAMVPNPEMEPNSVMDVMQKGYMLNGRLVRAAMVVVSK